MRIPTRGDVRAMHRHSKETTEQESFLMSRLTDLAIEDLDLLTLIDYQELEKTFRTLSGLPADDARAVATGG